MRFFFQEKVMMGLYPPQILKHHKNNISIVQVAGVDGIMEQNSSGNRLFYTFNINNITLLIIIFNI